KGKTVEFRFDLARVYYVQSKLEQAQAQWDSLRDEFKEVVDVQFALADAYKELGRYEDAMAAYETAQKMAPVGSEKRTDILLEEGRMLADRGDNTHALGLFTQA